MELRSVRLVPSPRSAGAVRLVGEVAYDDRPGSVEELWFEFPRALGDSLSSSGNPWLAVLIPLAAKLGEPLRIPLPVDRLLYRNVQELLAIWHIWHPSLHPVAVTAGEVEDRESSLTGELTAAFFSGGVDSFFTVLRNEIPGPASFPADELICVGGFDIPLGNIAAFERHAARMEEAAERLGKRLVPVVTNLRETRLESAGWFMLLHGAALIGIGLLLERRYGRLLIASSNDYGLPTPIGSHFLTDPLLSTSRTRVLHDGAAFRRCEKIQLLSESPVAMSSLHVCWRTAAEDNCCSCEKCLRTMVTLEILGRLEGCEAFPRRRIGPREVARVYTSREGLQRYWEELGVLALARGRSDIAEAIGRSMRRSGRVRPLLSWISRLRGKRLVWRSAGPLRRRLLKGAFR